ncbi:MAG: class II aldolase/adducin family protein [Fibrobacterota bacterium]
MQDEGYIKYSCFLDTSTAPPAADSMMVQNIRRKLYDIGLIGMYENGVGFGNVSCRSGKETMSFIITGSATGGSKILDREDFVEVETCDIQKNHVSAKGKIPPSSESMTHWAVYAAHEEIQAVVHVHSKDIFDYMKNAGAFCTRRNISYGTPQMARAIFRLVQTGLSPHGVFYTAGHDEGVFAYGRNESEVENAILNLYTKARGYA